MSAPHRSRTTLALIASGAIAVAGLSTTSPSVSPPAHAAAPADWDATAYRGQVEVVREAGSEPRSAETLKGRVFVDRDRDSSSDGGERGLPEVTVSNGRDVTTTDRFGRYELPAYENMTVFITQPAGYQSTGRRIECRAVPLHPSARGLPEAEVRRDQADRPLARRRQLSAGQEQGDRRSRAGLRDRRRSAAVRQDRDRVRA